MKMFAKRFIGSAVAGGLSVFLFVLSGCGKSETYKTEFKTSVDGQTEQAKEEMTEDCLDDSTAIDGQRDIYHQMTVMAENKEMWVDKPDYANDLYQYAVADLDHNGRYEIIVAHHGGTGHYTYSRFFEMNENFDGLTECETDFLEEDSQPDIISAELKTYIDDYGEFHYVVYDMLREDATDYYENYYELVLKEGNIIVTPIAYMRTIFEDGKEKITCKDSVGKVFSVEDFNEAVKLYFAGYQEIVTRLDWKDVDALETDTEKIVAQLLESIEVYESSGDF